jgi:pimeloyl-ACP methyl ester carboxylesterase
MTILELEHHRRTIDTPAGPVSCLDIGRGPTALFVHGVGTNARLWHRVITDLAGERRCVALDLPLHGSTPASPDQDFGLGALADVVESFCGAADLGPLDLVAHDTGGAVAQIFAARRPQRIRSLCLTDCDVHDNVPPDAFQPTVDLAASGALSAGAPALMADLDAARSLVFGSGYEDVARLDLEMVRSFLGPVIGTPERAKDFERFLLALRPDDLLEVEPDLRELAAPALIVWATDDVFFDLSWAYWLRDLLPAAVEVVEVDGARLFFPEERPGDLIAPLREFWRRIGS